MTSLAITKIDASSDDEVAESGRDEDQRESLQDKLASTEPALEMKVEDREVRLTFQNLDQVTVNYYEMDLEFLFSTNPFVESGGDRFSVIKPNYTAVVRLPTKGDTHCLSLPTDFAGKNVLVEVLGAGRPGLLRQQLQGSVGRTIRPTPSPTR